MAYLVLDLDLTTFVTTDDAQHIDDKTHTLSDNEYIGTSFDGNCKYNLRIINPKEIAQLITAAYTKHDGLLILTSGAWDATIREVLANALDLCELIKEKVRACRFHSIVTDVHYFKLSGLGVDLHQKDYLQKLLEKVRYLDKNTRLDAIIRYNQELSSKHFVMLDDNIGQIKSFMDTDNVDAVLATTRKPDADKKFYTRAINALDYAKAREQKAVYHTTHAVHGFFCQQLIEEENEAYPMQNQF